MNIYETFETEKDLEKNGVVIDYGSFSFTVARAGGSNQKYNKVLESLTKPFRRAIETETMDNSKTEAILMEVYAKSVILGWSGVTDKKGKPLEFNVKNCIEIFKDLPDLFKDIQSQSNKNVLFRKVIMEDEAKN